MSCRTEVNLRIIRANVETIKARTRTDVIAVLKCDAYGVGAVSVADAINDLVSGYYVFHPLEAIEARIFELTGKTTLVAVPGDRPDLMTFKANGIRPAVWTVDQARYFKSLRPVLAIDTGMQRFACPPEQIDAVLKAADITEAFTHASRASQVDAMLEAVGDRDLRLHAAGSALLYEQGCQLDAVRPGLAMFEGAVRVSARLIEARDSVGPVGYGGFESQRHGVILFGYSHGLRCGPCLVNGREQRIVEVGMQSAYVSLDSQDSAGDDVVLLGDDLSPERLAMSWATTPHNVLLTLAGLGERQFVT
jgi:alanine racemase